MSSKYIKQSKRGLVVLAMLAIVTSLCYVYIKEHAKTLDVEATHFSKSQIKINLSQPKLLTVGTTQRDFHGVQTCNIAFINGENFNHTIDIVSGTPAGLGGWLVDTVTKTSAKNAWIILANPSAGHSYQSRINLRSRAEDVEEAFGGDLGFAYSGFIAELDTKNVIAGKYHVYIIYDSTGTFYTCDNGRYLNILARQ